MAKGDPRVPRFARFLRERRGVRSRQAIVNQMASVGVKRGGSALEKIESLGRIPQVHVLRGLAAVYRIPFERLVDQVLEELGVAPVEWERLPSEAAIVAHTKAEQELLRTFRAITDPRDQLFIRDAVKRFRAAIRRASGPSRPNRVGRKPVNESSDKPAVGAGEL